MEKDAKEIIEKSMEKDLKKNGKGSAYIERTNYLLEKYRAALFFVFFQILVILLLLFGYITLKSNTVVEVMLPKIVKDTDYGKLKIGLDSSNELYYKIFGSYLVEALMNSDASDIEENVKVLKKILYPMSLKKYEKGINSFKSFVMQNNAALSYESFENSISIDDKNEALYEDKGKLFLQINNKKKEQICLTKVKMITKNYMLFVTAFVQNCKDVESKNEN